MNLWDRNRERRRRRILDAAAEIITEEGLSGLSMRKLGRAAEVSVATIYNVCGPRDEVVFAVTRDRFAQLVTVVQQVPPGKPIERMHSIITGTAQHLGTEPRINRAVLLAAMEIGPAPGSPGVFVGVAMANAIREATDSGLINEDLNPEVLGGHLLRGYLSAMFTWARGFVTTEGFEALALYSLYQSLLGVATEASRPDFLDHLRQLEPHILDGQSTMLSPAGEAESA